MAIYHLINISIHPTDLNIFKLEKLITKTGLPLKDIAHLNDKREILALFDSFIIPLRDLDIDANAFFKSDAIFIGERFRPRSHKIPLTLINGATIDIADALTEEAKYALSDKIFSTVISCIKEQILN